MSVAPDTLSLRRAAEECGYAYETFRKVWRRLATPGADNPLYCAFPMPFRQPPPGERGSIVWRASAIAEWKRAREAALALGAAPAPRPSLRLVEGPADPPAGSRGDARLQRQRADLHRLLNLGA